MTTLNEKISKYQHVFEILEDEQNTIHLRHVYEWFIFREKKYSFYKQIELDNDDKKLTQIMNINHQLISMDNLRNLLEPFPQIVLQIDYELKNMENKIHEKYKILTNSKQM